MRLGRYCLKIGLAVKKTFRHLNPAPLLPQYLRWASMGYGDNALLEAEVDAAIATCGGDVRAALRATLVANAYLESELERLTEAIL
jgi:hypothetical protein